MITVWRCEAQNESTLAFDLAKNKFYEAGMAPPIGGVDNGGRRRDFSFADMAAISGSWVSYIFTSLANLRTPGKESREQSSEFFFISGKFNSRRFCELCVEYMCINVFC